MVRLNPEKLHVKYTSGISKKDPISARRYTLIHSDRSGKLFLTIGREYDKKQISGIYTRLMRDEVLAEWITDDAKPALHVYCHVSGGLVFGPAGWRYAIFRSELPLVLEVFRYGDRSLFEAHPELDNAPIWIHFQASQPRYRKVEQWGKLADYKL
ncbi:MAG: staygreen family protein [Candidatus Jordarchaeum sp.]|uniref:staygreen family protein n=1 Tax=Candidatus Jordarchaeum sp. TaxID=2823881 RepID=UPI00404AD558